MAIDPSELRSFISDMYTDVAEFPRGDFHFPIGRPIMERLGYPQNSLDKIPAAALESYAGVGFHFSLDPLRVGERVLDIGSGSGSDACFAALEVGPSGAVLGVDMTQSMLRKARKNAEDAQLPQLMIQEGFAEELPADDGQFDCVVSNGVINLSPQKAKVFAEVARVLRPGGRLMFSDIVTGVELPPSVRENCELWAECIGGAVQRSRYLKMIEDAGFEVARSEINESYSFSPGSTSDAAKKFDVMSIRVLAYKPQ